MFVPSLLHHAKHVMCVQVDVVLLSDSRNFAEKSADRPGLNLSTLQYDTTARVGGRLAGWSTPPNFHFLHHIILSSCLRFKRIAVRQDEAPLHRLSN
jgi:hypothetical protein